jgi:hypothetical protein
MSKPAPAPIESTERTYYATVMIAQSYELEAESYEGAQAKFQRYLDALHVFSVFDEGVEEVDSVVEYAVDPTQPEDVAEVLRQAYNEGLPEDEQLPPLS